MFRLSVAQVDTLDEGAQETFIGALGAELRKEEHFRGLTVRQANAFARSAVARARGFGLETQNDLARFFGLMIHWAPNFDFHPEVREWLTSDALQPDERLDALEAEAEDALVLEVQEAATSLGWYLDRDPAMLSTTDRIMVALPRVLDVSNRNPLDEARLRLCIQAAAHDVEEHEFPPEPGLYLASIANAVWGDRWLQVPHRTASIGLGTEPAVHPKVKMALLRMRLALEAGVWA